MADDRFLESFSPYGLVKIRCLREPSLPEGTLNPTVLPLDVIGFWLWLMVLLLLILWWWWLWWWPDCTFPSSFSFVLLLPLLLLLLLKTSGSCCWGCVCWVWCSDCCCRGACGVWDLSLTNFAAAEIDGDGGRGWTLSLLAMPLSPGDFWTEEMAVGCDITIGSICGGIAPGALYVTGGRYVEYESNW